MGTVEETSSLKCTVRVLHCRISTSLFSTSPQSVDHGNGSSSRNNSECDIFNLNLSSNSTNASLILCNRVDLTTLLKSFENNRRKIITSSSSSPSSSSSTSSSFPSGFISKRKSSSLILLLLLSSSPSPSLSSSSISNPTWSLKIWRSSGETGRGISSASSPASSSPASSPSSSSSSSPASSTPSYFNSAKWDSLFPSVPSSLLFIPVALTSLDSSVSSLISFVGDESPMSITMSNSSTSARISSCVFFFDSTLPAIDSFVFGPYPFIPFFPILNLFSMRDLVVFRLITVLSSDFFAPKSDLIRRFGTGDGEKNRRCFVPSLSDASDVVVDVVVVDVVVTVCCRTVFLRLSSSS
eukprot:m.112051 g.112051  ORF g.112051 m.112051 type:complete len:354 (-) comp12776_c3_seq5:169-1230(-)